MWVPSTPSSGLFSFWAFSGRFTFHPGVNNRLCVVYALILWSTWYSLQVFLPQMFLAYHCSLSNKKPILSLFSLYWIAPAIHLFSAPGRCKKVVGQYKMQTADCRPVFLSFLFFILFHFITYRLSRNPFSDVIFQENSHYRGMILLHYSKYTFYILYFIYASKINSFLSVI